MEAWQEAVRFERKRELDRIGMPRPSPLPHLLLQPSFSNTVSDSGQWGHGGGDGRGGGGGGSIVSHIRKRQAEIATLWRGGAAKEDDVTAQKDDVTAQEEDVTAHEDDVSEDARARDAARLGGLGVASRSEVEKILDA